MNLLGLPWVGRRRARDAAVVLVFTSRFDSRSPLSGLVLTAYGILIWLAAIRSAGCLGASLQAKPWRGKYYTMSAWRSEDALRDFARSRTHRTAVKIVRRAGAVDGVLISWWEDGAVWRPRWRDAIRRADASPTGPYAGPQSPADLLGLR